MWPHEFDQSQTAPSQQQQQIRTIVPHLKERAEADILNKYAGELDDLYEKELQQFLRYVDVARIFYEGNPIGTEHSSPRLIAAKLLRHVFDIPQREALAVLDYMEEHHPVRGQRAHPLTTR